jgi:ribonucleotide reductase alpha subunit
MSGGVKFDTEKPRHDLLPVGAVEEVVKVLTFGAGKYGDHNWRKGMRYGRLYAAGQRHLTKFWRGIDIDEESGIHHLAHAACNILMLLSFELEGRKNHDDRYPSYDFVRDAFDDLLLSSRPKRDDKHHNDHPTLGGDPVPGHDDTSRTTGGATSYYVDLRHLGDSGDRVVSGGG